jgi:hypothetical protein
VAAYYASQAYDAPASYIWSVLTDFSSWPAWFPRLTRIDNENGNPAVGANLLAIGEHDDEWTRWRIAEWSAPALLVCEYVDSNVPVSHGVDAAYLQFEIFDEPDGCTLEVEIGADGRGVLGDFFIGIGMGLGARRIINQLIDAFSEHVVARAHEG